MYLEKSDDGKMIRLIEMGIPVLKGNKIKDEFAALFNRFVGRCYIDIEDCTTDETSIRKRIAKGLHSDGVAKSSFTMSITSLDQSVSCVVRYTGYFNLVNRCDSNDSKLTVTFELRDGDPNSPMALAVARLANGLRERYETRCIEG